MNKKILFLAFATLTLVACSSSGVSGEGAQVKKYTIGNGPVLIEEFVDFQCPACGQISPIVKAYALQNTDKVTLEYNHFPLSQHENAIPAAIAAECAGLQDRFWEFGEELFSNQANLGEEFYTEVAKKLELNETEFKTCLQNEATKEQVLMSLKEGGERKVNATPTFFVSVAGEEPQKVNFSADFFDFIEQKAKSAPITSSTVESEQEAAPVSE